jgi:DNA replication protein DnaC
MASDITKKLKIDEQILVSDKLICESIEKYDDSERGILSQIILNTLRDFTEHIMLKVCARDNDIEDSWDNIKNVVRYVRTRGDLKFLSRFHKFLQCSVSHYTPDEENAERLMLKYYEYLLKIKTFMSAVHDFEILGNLDKFPLNLDTDLQEYYEKIAERITNRNRTYEPNEVQSDRYYIYRVKPFFINQRVYYEITFIPATGKASKFDTVIAFTSLEVSKYYAVKLSLVNATIEVIGKKLTILIIDNWETSIRPCEISKLSCIFGMNLKSQGGTAEYYGLMEYLTKTGFTLVELLDFDDNSYHQTRENILHRAKAKVHRIFDILDMSRNIIKKKLPGHNILRYLLYNPKNRIIKDQLGESNNLLSWLHFDNRAKPFDDMPFTTSLADHNPQFRDLLECIDSKHRAHEMLARYIKNNTENREQLYTSANELVRFDNVDTLVEIYNRNLYKKHTGRKILKRNNHFYIKEYEDDTVFVIRKLIELTSSGIQNYSSSVNAWLSSGTYYIDCNEKKEFIRQMFENSMVALIYGSAGTGKSTIINHISHYFSTQSKLYLALTNPAINNLKQRVNAPDCVFMTIARYLNSKDISTEYDLLIIDESSTVSNKEMKEVLIKTDFEVLILVGDTHQIESIRFGNWFGVARGFVPEMSVFELTEPYRTESKDLLELWKRVRNMDETILELIARKRYSASLNATLFDRAEEDEIVLCLNYGGLYGINNTNRLLQEANNNIAVNWGIQNYKVGDPILFNEAERFSPLIHNNMKGVIAGVSLYANCIQFDIEMDIVITGLQARHYDFDLLPNSTKGKSVIRFTVDRHKSTEEDEDVSLDAVMPFQVAYAVSIHKAQGLEYRSVKVVISDEVDDMITHNIFYTAITRAREHLKIYWSPEVEQRVLGRIKPKNNEKDVKFLRQIISG